MVLILFVKSSLMLYLFLRVCIFILEILIFRDTNRPRAIFERWVLGLNCGKSAIARPTDRKIGFSILVADSKRKYITGRVGRSIEIDLGQFV